MTNYNFYNILSIRPNDLISEKMNYYRQHHENHLSFYSDKIIKLGKKFIDDVIDAMT